MAFAVIMAKIIFVLFFLNGWYIINSIYHSGHGEILNYLNKTCYKRELSSFVNNQDSYFNY